MNEFLNFVVTIGAFVFLGFAWNLHQKARTVLATVEVTAVETQEILQKLKGFQSLNRMECAPDGKGKFRIRNTWGANLEYELKDDKYEALK